MRTQKIHYGQKLTLKEKDLNYEYFFSNDEEEFWKDPHIERDAIYDENKELRAASLNKIIEQLTSPTQFCKKKNFYLFFNLFFLFFFFYFFLFFF